MSDTRKVEIEVEVPEVGGTNEHATNPLVASYDIIDFLTTVAFVTATIASTTSAIFPMVSNVLHILNYGLLTYIQVKSVHRLLSDKSKERLEKIEETEGLIKNAEQLEKAKEEVLPPKKSNKSNAEYGWDLSVYILKIMACLFLVALSVIGFTALAAYVAGVLLPIAYIATCAVNVLKFGKNLLSGIYDYLVKGSSTQESSYQINHKIVDDFENKLKGKSPDKVAVTEKELNDYLAARNAINKVGRDNSQNGIFLGISSGFLVASILILLSSSMIMTAALPPVGITISSALFLTGGVLFAVHGISVLANLVRRKKGLPEKLTFFDWVTEKMYPNVTREDVLQKWNRLEVTPEIQEVISVKKEDDPLLLTDVEDDRTIDKEEEVVKANVVVGQNPVDQHPPVMAAGDLGFFAHTDQHSSCNVEKRTCQYQ